MRDDEFQARMKRLLTEKRRLPESAEAALLEKAGALLQARREALTAREERWRRIAQSRARRWDATRGLGGRLLEFFAIHPDRPAAAATLAVLLLAFLALNTRGEFRGVGLRSGSEAQEFPKNNDFAARYDAQRLAEQQAYEREVEDAHQKTSGGI